jgi:hypothetical protein
LFSGAKEDRVRRRYVVLLLAGFTLAVPASASAHARTATVALDYRLVLRRATKQLPGVSVSILDGDRSLSLKVPRGLLVIRGDLGEPMLRISAAGSWANRASPTAAAEKLVSPGRGWKRVASGGSFAWHEHRLAPPPYDGGNTGPVAQFAIPATLDGRPVDLGGTFVRYRRPSVLPWAAAVGVVVVALAVALRLRPGIRPIAATLLGALAGLGALATLVAFGAADATNGRVAWSQLVVGVILACVLYGALFRAQGRQRVALAGVIGAIAAAVSLGSLSVFWHGVVISLLSANVSRGLLATAFAGGAAAALTSVLASQEAA